MSGFCVGRVYRESAKKEMTLGMAVKKANLQLLQTEKLAYEV